MATGTLHKRKTPLWGVVLRESRGLRGVVGKKEECLKPSTVRSAYECSGTIEEKRGDTRPFGDSDTP
jgi:hypothetical protein